MIFRLPENPARTLEVGKRISGVIRPCADGPLVSVVTVVYNNAATLQRCIDSVVAQQGVRVEYLMIDGGSTDGTADIIRANAGHIDYAVSEPDRGIYDAMNKGISLAHGDYIALINSDDWLEPDGLKLSVENIRANGAEVSIGFANVWDKHGKFSHVWKIGNFDARILTSGMSFCHQALIASRKAYETVGPFDDRIRISSDYKWIKQLYLSGLKTVFTEVPVVNFSFDGLAANNRPIWKGECKELLTEQFPFLAPDDVSAFLEYVYRDAPFDQNAVENLLMHAGTSPLLLQSLGLVLLDRLFARELEKKHVVSANRRVALKPPQRGLLSLQPPSGRPRPKISVVIPIYNVERYLEECVRSVMEQSLRDIEIICVNDGSPDNSQAILEQLQAEDPRIRIIVKENGGLSSARNAGIRAATGEYVHMLDSDDYIKPGMYDALYLHAKMHNLELVKSNLGFIDEVYPTKRPILPEAEAFTFSDCPDSAAFITPCGALYSREMLQRTALFPEGMTYEDRPFNWETLIEAERIGHVDEIFYMYRVGRPGSIMSSRKGNMRHFDAFRAVDKIRELLEDRNLLENFKVEYVKEQLRVYSMLIDIDAIPRPAYGRFFWEMRDRIDADRVPIQEIQKAPMPPRVKALYAFLASGEPRDDLALEGEKYFFHGVDYAKTARNYAGSSCELFLVAEHAIEHRFPSLDDGAPQRLRKAVASSLLFDSIHFNGLDTVKDVIAALAKVTDITSSADFDALMSALLDAPPATALRAVRHLAFRYSEASNYRDCERFLTAYGAARDLDIVFFDSDDVNKIILPPTISRPTRKIIEQIRTLGLRPFPFSMIVGTAFYVHQQFDLSAVETTTVLLPHSAPERFLIELFRGRCKVIFLPHGMPQLSMATARPDVVLALTDDKTWQEVFPEAQIIHAGWPEAFEQPLPPMRCGTRAKTILFLSQIQGCEIHRLDDLVTVASHFMNFALSDRAREYHIILRLRNRDELEFLNKDFVRAIEGCSNISLSTMTDGPMHKFDVDLIVSASSTGLLYSSVMEVPLLQLTSKRILQHWPFIFGTDDSVLSISEGIPAIAQKVEELLAEAQYPSGAVSRVSKVETFGQLDRAYRHDSQVTSKAGRDEPGAGSTAENRVLEVTAMVLLGRANPAIRAELERLLELPTLKSKVAEFAREVISLYS